MSLDSLLSWDPGVWLPQPDLSVVIKPLNALLGGRGWCAIPLPMPVDSCVQFPISFPFIMLTL